jgi:hypothetical protein
MMSRECNYPIAIRTITAQLHAQLLCEPEDALSVRRPTCPGTYREPDISTLLLQNLVLIGHVAICHWKAMPRCPGLYRAQKLAELLRCPRWVVCTIAT